MERVLGCAFAAVVGFLTGVATTVLHSADALLALGAAATLTAAWACAPGWSRVVFSIAWVVPVACLMVPRPEGDFLVGSDLPGYGLIALAMVVVTYATVTIPRARPAADTPTESVAPPAAR